MIKTTREISPVLAMQITVKHVWLGPVPRDKMGQTVLNKKNAIRRIKLKSRFSFGLTKAALLAELETFLLYFL